MGNKLNLKKFALIGIMIMAISCSPKSQTAVSQPESETTSADFQKKFTLITGADEGRLFFMGVGGEIDGQMNPDLKVQVGDTVLIELINGDGMIHDLALPDLGVASTIVAEKKQSTEVIFKVEENGEYSYFCTISGHRQAGMEGRLIVGTGEDQKVMENAVENSIVRPPSDLPSPLQRTSAENVRVDLETIEVEARLADGASYKFWTFNGKLPGPFIRVRVGDTVEVYLKNSEGSEFSHSVDFHAATGPGGGAVASQTLPGETTSFTFKALKPGLFVYHCATPLVAHHIANGMYGLILVEPEEGLIPVDHEFYVMQGEIYTTEKMGTKGLNSFDIEKLLDEQPEYLVFNGAVGGLTNEAPLKANVGDTVRIFFGVGGPNLISSFHVIGEIFDRVYNLASLTSLPLTDVQTTLVPPGGAAIVEFGLDVPGRYLLVDHALSRLERGLVGYLEVEGPDAPEIFNGTASGD